jgi:hypothetical protein
VVDSVYFKQKKSEMKTNRKSLIVVFISIFWGVACNLSDLVVVDMTVAPTDIPRSATTHLVLTTSDDMGAGSPVVTIMPTTGLTLAAPQKQNGTTVTVDVTATAAAPLGARMLVLKTDDIIASADVAVIAAAPPSATFACDPSSVEQGDVAAIAVVGTATHFSSASAISLAGGSTTGVTLGAFSATDATHGLFQITVANDATLGAAALQIVTGTEIATGSIFIDQWTPPPTPSIVVIPDSMRAGATGNVTITGTNTHFSAGSEVSFGVDSGIVVTGVVFSEPAGVQTLTATVEVDASATVGGRTLTVTSPYGSGQEIVTTDFEVTPGPSLAVTPSEGDQGETIHVVLTGTNTSFESDGTLVLIEHATDSGASGVQIDVTDIIPPSVIEADIAIDEDATIGTWTISVQTGSELVTASFQVNDVVFVPSLVASPNEGDAGDTLDVVLTGTHTHFDDAATVLTSGSTDLEVVDFVVDDVAQTITATIHLMPDASSAIVELIATTGSEDVRAPFTVHAALSNCNSMVIDPEALSIGRFGATVSLEQEGASWIVGESAVSIVGDPEHIWFGNESDGATTRCYVSTGSHITCAATVGVYAIPGDYAVEVTTGSEVLCGVLTITADDIEEGLVPGGELPTYGATSGDIDPGEGDRSDFYTFDVEAGDTVIFHAYSLDRDTLDPVLRLIEPSGDRWLAYEDDETAMGIDSRIVYWFAESGTYIVEVGPKTDDYLGTGDYDLYVYRLTFGGTVQEDPEEESADGGVQEDGGIFADAQDLGSVASSVVLGTLVDSGDVDVYRLDADGPMALDVVARRLGAYDGSTADTKIEAFATSDTDTIVAQNGTWNEVPGTDDPRVFLSSAGSYYVVVSSQNGSSGMYALDARPRVVINEIDNRAATTEPFVELVGPPNFDLSEYSLCAYGADGESVDAAYECVSLAGVTTNAWGYRAVYGTDFTAEATLDLPAGAGAVVLERNGAIEDAVQYGTLSSGSFAEGAPAEVGTNRAIGRGAEVDTNDNKIDFIYMASPTPDAPNDRACQAAVPLFGETAG